MHAIDTGVTCIQARAYRAHLVPVPRLCRIARYMSGGTMSSINRRDFLRASSAAALGMGVPAEAFAQTAAAPGARWDAGSVRHLLPAVSDSRMLIKASFMAPLAGAPTLRVGNVPVHGRMGDTR